MPVRATGLVGQYHFKTTGRDDSGFDRHATIVGGTWVPDRNGNPFGAVQLGEGSSITLPQESAFDLAAFTVVMNVRLTPSMLGADDTLITKGEQGYGAFSITRFNVFEGMAMYGHDTAQGEFLTFVSGSPLPVGPNVCVATAVDGNSVRTYINGQLYQEVLNPPPRLFNNDPVRIGGMSSSTQSYFHGVVDEVEIYNSKLSTGGVQAACN
jgi:hypothetical protein